MLPPVPDPFSGYEPTVSPDHIELIRRWHERAYPEAQAGGATDQIVDYLGFTIVVPPEVMPITPMSLLGEAVLAEVQAGERVLDMGTGSGVNAILAASRGAQVVAVDINAKALDAARMNAVRNWHEGRVETRYSDVFDNVESTFELIIFDPPFRWFRARSIFESASTDEGYRAMTRFFRQARDHLSRSARMQIFFGTTGDLAYLQQLVAEEGFTATTVAHDSLVRDGWAVDYFTFRPLTNLHAKGDDTLDRSFDQVEPPT